MPENMNKKKLRYVILKEIDSGNKELTEKDFGVDTESFDEAVRYLDREGYLKGFFYADDRHWLFDDSAHATGKGEDYLTENSKWAKAYNGLKEARDWLKL